MIQMCAQSDARPDKGMKEKEREREREKNQSKFGNCGTNSQNFEPT
jgi:hypothetical protein